MPKRKKRQSTGRMIISELFGFGTEIVKAGFDLTVETPIQGLRETLSKFQLG